ncbi:MAG: replication factor C large subunit [Halobacteriales archaeon]
MSDWTEVHRPETLAEVRGNDKARDAFREWAETWEDHREAVVLHGSPGVGKTSAAHALAADMAWDVMELNASDSRTADVIERVAGRAASNATLAGAAGGDDDGRQLIVIDEADNLHQHKDRGGARAMTDLVKEAGQPIVLIANEYYEMSRGLRGATREIEFRDVSARSIVPVMRDVCRKENVTYDEETLQSIADRNDGDLRSAIRDLQAAVEDGTVEATDVTGYRDRTVDVFGFLDAVLKEESAEDALRTAYDADETPDDLLLWVEDKVPAVYEGAELADAYEFLANADRWLGRVRATQNYSYWRYATDNLAAGVAAVRREDRGGWTRYGGAPYRSSRDSTRDYVARQIAAEHGVSMGTARREVLPFLSTITHHCKNRDLTVRMAATYDMDTEHVAFVTGSGESTNKVQDIVAEAREVRGGGVTENEGYFEDVDGDGNGTDDEDGEDGGGPDSDDAGGETAVEDGDDEDQSQAGLDDFM